MAKRKTLAEILKREIEASGLSARKLADLCGVPQQRISDFLLGGDIRLSTAEKLAAYFGMTLVGTK